MTLRTRRRGIPAAVFCLLVAAGCGQWQRVGSNTGPDPTVIIPQLFDPTGIYKQMGLFGTSTPLTFVAGIRYLASPSPDSTLTLFGLSLANNTLSFRRVEGGYAARYRAELLLRRAGTVVDRLASEETVRVASRQEALRADESVIFQQVIRLVPGAYLATVTVRDEYAGTFSRDEHTITVPAVGPRTLSDLIPVYRVEPRHTASETPRLLLNPRATVPFGLDTLRFYVEAYAGAPAGPLAVTAYGATGDQVWSGDFPLSATAGLRWAVVRLLPEQLPVGELRFVARLGVDSVSAPALVSFSDQWAITNFDDVLFLLRYFGQDRAVAKMRAAAPADRPRLWRDFWKATDPNPATPENEALRAYFQRVQEANASFREAGDPGWLTDRGEVYITLGPADEVFDASSDFQGARRVYRWNYFSYRLTLDFVDETGFGRFRLTPAARAEYQRVLNGIRSRG
jgi:GWxTD domain-containing protein